MPIQLSEQQKKKLEKLYKVMEGGDVAILEHLFELEQSFEEKVTELKTAFIEAVKLVRSSVPDVKDILEQVKGKPGDKGDKPVAGVDYPLPENGIDGKNYVLTEQDKKDIARSIKVPIVDRIIERTDIIHETPILKTEIVKETIKEIVSGETGETIVNKINDLDLDPEKQISFEHIKGWKEYLRDEFARHGRAVYVPTGSSSSSTTASSGHGAPATTPSALGNMYIDLDTQNIYIATGTTSSANWNLVTSYVQ